MKRLLPYLLISVTVILIYVDVVIELDRRARERLESVIHSEFALSAERQAYAIESRLNNFLEQVAYWAETSSVDARELRNTESLERILEPVLLPSFRQALYAVVFTSDSSDDPRSIYWPGDSADLPELDLSDSSCCQMESGPLYTTFFSTNEFLLAELTLPVRDAGRSAGGLLHFLVDLDAVAETGPVVESEAVRIFSAGHPELSDEDFSRLDPQDRERFLARLQAMSTGSFSVTTDEENLHFTWYTLELEGIRIQVLIMELHPPFFASFDEARQENLIMGGLLSLALLGGGILSFYVQQNDLRRQVDLRTSELAHERESLRSEIVHREQVELALRTSEQRFRSIFESATLGIVVLNREGYPVEVNEAFEELSAYQKSIFTTMHINTFMLPAESQQQALPLQAILDRSLPHYRDECRVRCQDGAEFPVMIDLTLLPAADGAGESLLLVVQDITQQKTAEAALKDFNAELERQVHDRTAALEAANNRLRQLDAIKSKFIADVSHELRTPLAALHTRIYLLQKSEPEKRERLLGGLQRQVDRLTEFVEAVLDMSRLDISKTNLELKPVDLNAVVHQVVETMRSRAEQFDLELDFVPATQLVPVQGDSNRLVQVVNNLLANAINYTPSGGIHVETRYDSVRKAAELIVRDTGLGIDEEDMPYLFDRFYRGKQAVQTNHAGTGLGLAISREIIEVHGGTIEVESEPGVGTVFHVWLPSVLDKDPGKHQTSA